jgi:TatD DNase family protein
MFDFIDIHSHLYFPEYDSDRDQVIGEMQDKNIATITVGVDFDTSAQCVDFSEKHGNIFACVGQHPGDLKSDSVFDERIKDLARHPRTVAIGECGLDYFRLEGDIEGLKAMQKRVFEAHIDLALETGKPLMLHIRPSDKINFDAYKDSLDILERRYAESGGMLRGNAHFFIGDMGVLKRFLAIGFTVSFGGVLTFTHEYDQYVHHAPLDMIHAETDAPFVAPVPYRGKRNSPAYIPEIVKKIAEIKQLPLDAVQAALKENATRLFKIGK